MDKKHTRIRELDLVKGFAIIFMVFVHVYEFGSDNIVLNDSLSVFFADLIEFLGNAPAAPVFMFCMGVGFAYSRATSSKYVKRAGIFICLSLLVNFFANYVPLLFKENTVEDVIDTLPSIISADIYTFVALCILFIAFIKIFDKKLHIKLCIIFLIVFGIVNAILSSTLQATGNAWLDTFLGFFVRLNEWSYFPFFVWINFPIIGYIIGILYKNSKNKNKLELILLFLAILFIFGSSAYMNYTGMINSVEFASTNPGDFNYYAMSIPNILYSLGIVIICISICKLLLLIKPLEKVHNMLFFMSKNIIIMYVLHWVYIGFSTYIIDRVSTIYALMLIAFIILVLTTLTTYCYCRIKNNGII